MADTQRNQAEKTESSHSNITMENVHVGGSITGSMIVGHHNVVGFNSEQVAALIAQISSTFTPKPFTGTCPYKGLDPFDEEDAGLFFGREKLVEELVSRVKASRTVFVTGPSGSGKSSLVRAGLLCALKQGAVKDSAAWVYARMKPGRDPLQALARAVSAAVHSTNAEDEILSKAPTDRSVFARWCEIALQEGQGKRFVLFIDQFEEVFTQVGRDDQRAVFLNLLTHAANVEGGRAIILFTMRSDFVANCAAHPELNQLLNRQFIQIGAMQADELVNAIAQPALRTGLRIDPDLIAQIINDMDGEPGSLPLMQFALKDLFDAQQAKGGLVALSLEEYLSRGGIHKALERHADQTFAGFGQEEQELARVIFTGLIEIGRGTQDTRRTASFRELVPASSNPADVQDVVARLADARLVTTDDQIVTLAHERLIDAWPWLKRLVNENRDLIALQNEIAEDAREWDEHKREPSYLYAGGRLANTLEQIQSKKITLTGMSGEFIESGVIARNAATRAAELLRRKIITGLSLGVIISILLAGIATYGMLEARQQTKLARAGEIAAQSVALRDSNFQLSTLLSIEAYHRLRNPQSLGAILDNVQANPSIIAFLDGHSKPVYSIAYSPNEDLVASGGGDGIIILWDVKAHQPIGQPLLGHTDWVNSVAFSPDGKMLASGSADNTIILWDVKTHQPIGQPLLGHTDWVNSVAFSPDGKHLASGSSAQDGIIIWDIKTHQPIAPPLMGHTAYVSSIDFSPDGKTLVSGSWDYSIRLWDLETHQAVGEPLTKHSSWVLSVAFSPDGRVIASGGSDDQIILWDAGTRQPVGNPMAGDSGAVLGLDFSPDGKMLAAGNGNNTVTLWDIKNQLPVGVPYKGHAHPVTSVAFSPSGDKIVSGSRDNTVILWDAEKVNSLGLGNQRIAIRSIPIEKGLIQNIAFLQKENTLVSGNIDGTISFWDPDTGNAKVPALNTGASTWGFYFPQTGDTIATSGTENTVKLWDRKTHKGIGEIVVGYTTSSAISPDGKLLATTDINNAIIVWNLETRQSIASPFFGHTTPIYSMAFSPDGKTLASGSADGKIILWDLTAPQLVGIPLTGHNESITVLAFSPDGKSLASGSNDFTVVIWDITHHTSVGPPLTGHTGAITSVTFSLQSDILASGSRDYNIMLWDMETFQPVGQPLVGHTESVSSLAFSPTGNILASSGADNIIILWDLDPISWINKSCTLIGRNLTRREWERYFPDEIYPSIREQATCPQWTLEAKNNPTP